jgi:pimeloyl-ACP methyl ester carboxylesterase
VLVPGIGLGHEAWRPTVRALDRARLASCSVLPLPGYGVPAARRDELAPDVLAGTMVDRTPAGDGPRFLVGHSASCQIVAWAAARPTYRADGLVLIGPTTDPRGRTWPRLAGRWLATARHERPGQVPALVRQYARTGPGSMLRAMDAARQDRIEEVLAAVSCPVLVLRGRHDRICPEDWAQVLVGATGDASGLSCSTTLPVGGHMVPLTHGDLVAAAITGFVGRVLS